ncbi:MAG: energy-coupling factor transporter transmembrane protein EcfT [Spirochaetes bacterium]|nr:energy-coupling factor transporter transmembrane protein EcfT [Spirochaetota bacterium]
MNRSAARRNPLAILLVTLFLLIPVLLSFDPITPVVFFCLGIVNLAIAGRVNIQKYLLTVGILSGVGVGLFLLNVLFPANGMNGFQRGVTVFLRSTTLVSLSVGYILLVDPYDLIRSLMQNLRLSPRIGFALFAGWNVIPLLKRDLEIIRHTHAVRFGGVGKPFKGFLRGAVTLLSGAVRHGERVSLSMAARGIDEMNNRTFIKTIQWTWKDTIYCFMGFGVTVGAFLLILQSGQFVFELG